MIFSFMGKHYILLLKHPLCIFSVLFFSQFNTEILMFKVINI